MIGVIRGRFAAAWQWLDESGPGQMLRRQARLLLVVQFVLALLLAIIVAEPLFALTGLAWDEVWPKSGVGPAEEPFLRAFALLLAALASLLVLVWLIRVLRGKLGQKMEAGTGTHEVDERALSRTIWLLVALLLIESFTAEIFIEGARLGGLEGGWLAVALGLLLLVLLPALVVVAAASLHSAEPLFATRFHNSIEEAAGRPDSWPAAIVIGALSTPPDHLVKDKKGKGLKRYEGYAAPDVAGRFRLFSDPRGLAATIPDADADHADIFVKSFNWRQIALAYKEQIPDDPPEPERLPRLILLTSAESAEHIGAFDDFFAWLLAPFGDPALAGRLLEVHETAIDFEELGHIEDKLEAVYDRACREVGAAKVVIDITGAQRPWALAAVGATLGSRDRIVSYVAQKSFQRAGQKAWVRYYNLDGKTPKINDPAKAQLAMD